MHRIAKILRDAALGRSEQRLCAFVESSPLAAAIVDPDGLPLHVNPAWQSLYADGADTIFLRMPELAPFCRAAAAGETCVTPGMLLPAADGAAERWVRAFLFPVRRSSAGTEVGVVLEEVTAQRRAEDAQRNADRRESLGTLAGGIAHDFNNLLTGILGNASLALRALPNTDQVGELLREVIRSAERGAELTQQLLAYAGKGRLQLSTVDVTELIRDIEPRVRESLPPEIAVSYQLADVLPAIEADSGQIRQLFLSLIANAVEAIGGRPGAIAIATASAELATDAVPPEFGAFDIGPGRYVRLEVRDSGSGMDHGTQARVFEPFFTTKFLGRGLGLAAALGIVRSHQGAISVRSEPGAGSTFTVLLPVTAHHVGGALRTRPSSEQVLVVDHEPATRRVATAMLQEHGYTVLATGSGPEAVARLAESPDIRLAVVDVAIPGMTAAETVRAMQRVRPGLPIVVTGADSPATGFHDGEVSRVVTRPFSAEDLAGSVAAALRNRAGR